jgi:predicted RNA binding protein YcfA (HicA-like mRNA interferase family)
VNRKKLLLRLSRGHIQNVSFKDIANLVKGFGFALARRSGSHHIYSRPDVPEVINLQDVNGQAKPYQIRQLLKLVERYNLDLEG